MAEPKWTSYRILIPIQEYQEQVNVSTVGWQEYLPSLEEQACPNAIRIPKIFYKFYKDHLVWATTKKEYLANVFHVICRYIFRNLWSVNIFANSVKFWSFSSIPVLILYRLYKSAIDLLSDTTSLRSCVYCFTEHLKPGYIMHISCISWWIPFSSEEKGRLSPCIDYCGLKQISVKYYYLLPHLLSALGELGPTVIFTQT